jgi:hypothetical protein
MTRREPAPLRRAAAHQRAALGAASVALLALGGAESLHAATPSDSPTGLQSEVVFADYSPLAGSPELMRRLLSPLTVMQVRSQSAHAGKPLRETAHRFGEREVHALRTHPNTGKGLCATGVRAAVAGGRGAAALDSGSRSPRNDIRQRVEFR